MDATSSLLPVSDEDVDFRTAHCTEPTIGELLADPLTRALMKADRVDIGAFEQVLRSVASRLSASRRVATQPIVALKTGVGSKGGPPLPHYLRWAPVDRFHGSAAARSMHGVLVTKALETSCGSHCSW
jgi:hypothetical protein